MRGYLSEICFQDILKFSDLQSYCSVESLEKGFCSDAHISSVHELCCVSKSQSGDVCIVEVQSDGRFFLQQFSSDVSRVNSDHDEVHVDGVSMAICFRVCSVVFLSPEEFSEFEVMSFVRVVSYSELTWFPGIWDVSISSSFVTRPVWRLLLPIEVVGNVGYGIFPPKILKFIGRCPPQRRMRLSDPRRLILPTETLWSSVYKAGL